MQDRMQDPKQDLIQDNPMQGPNQGRKQGPIPNPGRLRDRTPRKGGRRKASPVVPDTRLSGMMQSGWRGRRKRPRTVQGLMLLPGRMEQGQMEQSMAWMAKSPRRPRANAVPTAAGCPPSSD